MVCVVPGFVLTEGAEQHLTQIADQQGIDGPTFVKQVVDGVQLPMGQPGDPEDVAEMIAFLASPRAKWLTGAQYRVDGGILPTV